jgi:hypothetical protein
MPERYPTKYVNSISFGEISFDLPHSTVVSKEKKYD